MTTQYAWTKAEDFIPTEHELVLSRTIVAGTNDIKVVRLAVLHEDTWHDSETGKPLINHPTHFCRFPAVPE